MTDEERGGLIAEYERKYAKRKNAPGYGSNAEDLARRIANLKAGREEDDNGD